MTARIPFREIQVNLEDVPGSMALDVVQPSLAHERPHHRGRRQCSCCPYGYHIDLDFVRYCESITNAQLMPSVSIKRSKWNNVRRKRASREALLGLVNTQASEPVKAEPSTVVSSYMGDDLQRAVLDFEKTLKHASLPRMSSKKDWNGFDTAEYNHACHPKNHVPHGTYTSHTLPRNCGKSDRDGAHVISPLPIEEMLFSGANFNNASAETLQNIREQMAASLRRMKELEEHNKQIPLINDKIGFLNKENENLRKELRNKEALQHTAEQVGVLRKENDSLRNEIKRLESQKIKSGQLEILRKENESLRIEIRQKQSPELNAKTPVVSSDKFTSTSDLVHCRAAAVGCTVITREVGISPTVLVTRSIGVATEPKPEPRLSKADPVSLDKIIGKNVSVNHKTVGVNTEPEKPSAPERPQVRNVSIFTDLKMGDVVSRSDMYSRLEELKKKTASPPKASIRVNTHLHHNQIFTQNDLDERVSRFAKTYETNFLNTNLPKKPATANSHVQTVNKIEKKHIGLQIHPKVSDAAVTAKSPNSTQGVQALVHTKDVAVSEDTTVPEICEKCRVKRSSVGTLFPDRSEQLLQRINSSSEMTVAKKDTKSRSTDTRELCPTRDAAMNTARKDLIAKAVETGDYSCNRCSSQQMNHHMTSRTETHNVTSHVASLVASPVTPTKPSGTPLPAKRPSYLPISVSRVKPPSTPSPQPTPPPLQHEGSNSDSGSDDGTYTIHQDVGAGVKDDPFQDLSPKPRSYSSASRREPSKEMRGAMKVLNDALLKSPGGDIPKHVKTAVNIVQQEWFKVSSVASANPLDVEYYLDCFEEISGTLLEYVVNMTDVSGNTAMHYAVSNGNFDVVSILLDSKVCNINKLNTAGYTCVMLVALTKVKSETDREVVRRLFHMADVNIRAKEHGQTALMLAVSHGRIDTVELLLEAGADINIQDEDGSTALMCAAEHGYIEIVKLLLAQPDCDLSVTDYDGTTALAIAMEAGNRDIGVLLYAQEHFSRGSSPYTSLKHKRAKSTTPTLKGSRPSTPSHSSHKRDSDVLES